MKSILACLASCILVVVLILGCGGNGNSQYMQSVARVKKLNDAMFMYTGDWDDFLPLGPNWMDLLTPYVPDPTTFNSPAIAPASYGYAMNSAIPGLSVSAVGDREHTLSIFDSTVIQRNALADPNTVPGPPRYGSRNTLGYMDGYVQDEGGLPPSNITLYAQSRARLKSVSVAMLMYSSDYDDFTPLAGKWVDELSPYDPHLRDFRSPKVERTNPNLFGYGFNIDLSGVSLTSLLNPATTITFFDSTNLNRNATGPLSTMPNPGRYQGKNTIGYADGHVDD